MSVKDITQYHTYSLDDLSKLSTRHLLNILDSSRGRYICSCGKGHHCGDDVLRPDEKWFNDKQDILKSDVLSILKTREHLKSTKPTHKVEKKVMKYKA